MGWNPFREVDRAVRDVTSQVGEAARRDPITKLVLAPVRAAAAGDPLYQRVTTGRFGSDDERIRGGVHALFSADPLGKHVGVREEDAVTMAKIAGALAAIYFSAGAVTGGSTAAPATGTGGGLGGGAAVAPVAAPGAFGTAYTAKDLLAIGSIVASTGSIVAAKSLKPGEPPGAPDLADPFSNPGVESSAGRQRRKSQADMGRFDTILTGPLGLSTDELGQSLAAAHKTILGS